ncbi:hypothetical protein JCM11251_000082 [Rhodosporidiobolus azoricus]
MNGSTRSVEEVTRACYARGVPAATWLSLVEQTAERNGRGVQGTEKAVTESLLTLLQASDPPPPTLLEYLRVALRSESPARTPLIQPGALARDATTGSLSTLSANEAVFGAVNSALFANPKSPCYAASTAEEVAEALPVVLRHLLPLLSTRPAPETARWLCRFLTKPLQRLSKKVVLPEVLEECAAALQEASVSLDSGRTDLAEVSATLDTLRGRLVSRANQRSAVPVSLEELSRPLTHEPDAVLLASHLLLHPHDPSIPTRLDSFLRYRLSRVNSRKSTSQEALSRALADLFLPIVKAVEGMGREDKAVDGLVLAKLPRLLADAYDTLDVADAGDLETTLSSALHLVRSALASPSTDDGMDMDNLTLPASQTFDELVTALCQQSLLTSDGGASLVTHVGRGELEPAQPGDHTTRLAGCDPDELKQVLEELVSSRPTQQAIAFALRDTISSLAATSPPDLPNLATTCEILAENSDFLSVLFLHVEPREVLDPVRKALDSFDVTQDDYGDNNAVERYGALVLFVQTTVARFGLYTNVAYHLGSASSFFASWLTSVSATYPLSIMTEEERTAVSGWIAALFGEGISDDLMHATNPRTLLRVAPTILKQSLMACQAGVVDLDNLRDALSYFLQELLRFTLPGVLKWLIDEIIITSPSPARDAMLDILGVFVFSDSLPLPVLELIAPSLASLVAFLPPTDQPTPAQKGPTAPQPLDQTKLRKVIAPFRPKRQAVKWHQPEVETSEAGLLSTLSSLMNSPTSPSYLPLSLSALLSAALNSSPTPSTLLRTTLLPHLLSLAFPSPLFVPPTEEPLEPYLRLSRIERAGSAFLAFSPSLSPTSTILPPLLSAFAMQVLPASFPGWATRRFLVAGSDEQRKVELLADMLGGAIVSLPNERARTRILHGLERAANEAVQAAKREQVVPVSATEDDEGATALSVFFTRLSNGEGFLQQCPGLVELAGIA